MRKELENQVKTHHLPQQFTSFVGREQELADINRRLQDPACRLLTLVGPGGIGKTRLAMRVTAVSAPHFPAGTYYINLQPVQTEEFLITAVADALEISLTGQDSPLAFIRDFLADRQILITLDNFEQLLDASPVLSELLIGTRTKFLITSRETLNLQEEWLYPISGMNFPPQTTSPEDVTNFSAIQLFVDRAQRIRPDFDFNQDTASVTRICQVVEGMPLALELAAPWINFMRIDEIATEIERNLDFLATRLRNVPERHRSLQAVFAQTWDRLNEQEQAVFQRLAVFQGGFLRDAAATVAGASLPLLSSLLDKSLLRWELDDEGNGRYQIHELLRQYAAEKLFAHPQTAAETLAKHAHAYAAFLEQCHENLLGGRQMAAMQEIDAELGNIRAAWEWAVAENEWSIIHKSLEPLHLFCDMQGRFVEGQALFQLAIQQLKASADEETHPILGRILSRYRFMQVYAPSSPDEIEADLQTSLAIALEQEDTLEIAFAYLALGGITFYVKNDPVAAIPFFEKCLPLFQAQKHALYEARTLNWLAISYPESGALLKYCEASLKVSRANNNKSDALIALGNLAEVALTVGDYEQAEAYCKEAITTADEMKFHIVSAHTRTLLSLTCFLRGEWAEATVLMQASLKQSQDLNIGMAIGYAEGLFGLYESMMGNYEQGRLLSERSAGHQANHGLGLVTAYWGLAAAHCGLQAYDAAWEVVWQGFEQAQAAESMAMVMWLLPITAVLLHRQGKSKPAGQLLALASTHPLSPTGWMAKWELLDDVKREMGWERETAVSLSHPQSLEDIIADIKQMSQAPAVAAQNELNKAAMTPAAAANQSLIDPLTNRELEVLQLIAEGLTNQQIADKLIISRGTVKYYTSHIYSKLQVANRTRAIAHARQLGILSS